MEEIRKTNVRTKETSQNTAPQFRKRRVDQNFLFSLQVIAERQLKIKKIIDDVNEPARSICKAIEEINAPMRGVRKLVMEQSETVIPYRKLVRQLLWI